MITPKVLYQIKEYANTSFQPSNGTEGMVFMDAFCERCIHDHTPIDKFCSILGNTMVYSPGDKEYPKEWIYNSEGWPVCTAWKKWDWGNGDDGWNMPPDPPYEPQDPGQLTIFTIDELIEENNRTLINHECTNS